MTTANVSLRGFQIAQDASVQQRDGSAIFISLSKPPPVRALLELEVDGERKAVRVRSVDETGRDDGGPGCVAEWVELDEFDGVAGRVGSEHLAAGGDDGSSSSSRPAPVVVTDEPSGVIDMREDDGEAAAAQSSADAEDATAADETDGDGDDAEASAAEGEASSEADASDDDDKPKKATKKRKGRKRK